VKLNLNYFFLGCHITQTLSNAEQCNHPGKLALLYRRLAGKKTHKKCLVKVHATSCPAISGEHSKDATASKLMDSAEEHPWDLNLRPSATSVVCITTNPPLMGLYKVKYVQLDILRWWDVLVRAQEQERQEKRNNIVKTPACQLRSRW
jgi:hypothetical protein